jgi:hypothetical protein
VIVVIILRTVRRKEPLRPLFFGLLIGFGIAAANALLIVLVLYVLPPIIVYFFP